MSTIKFSHDYPKLWGQRFAKLIEVYEIDDSDINEDLKEYDTLWDDNGDLGHYELPKGKKLQLIFFGEKRIPFCTIRRYTLEKKNYYSKLIHQEFKIEIDKDKLNETKESK